MNYKRIGLALSLVLTVIFWVQYTKEMEKNKKDRNKTNINIYLYGGIISLILSLVFLAYIVYNYKKNRTNKQVEYHSKKIIEHFLGPLPADKRRIALLEECDNLHNVFPDRKVEEQYSTFKEDFKTRGNHYRNQLQRGYETGNNELIRESLEKIEQVGYENVNMCKNFAMTNLNLKVL